ncbi:hypothetical protein [Nocardioides mesophilus]|uniref:Ig-like domain repeat protein n=1 Tax=Nocardioides mesophilus TaxID=433659 RepID=A0A7G9REC2_9ACTN|nr:hypothetical protein [Nocardioides mesophilus]QNN53947.1 hypothetical protein H9L09_06070 [Nocardioides mesophilus]
MFAAILKKSVASAAAAGAVIAVAGLSAPATVGSSPSIEKVACKKDYPSAIATITNVALRNPAQPYGLTNVAVATVTANVGKPTGNVRISVAGRSWTVGVNNGVARKTLPRDLAAQETYPVSARFVPNCDTGEYGGSSDTTYLTVTRADTSITRLKAPNRRAGGHPSVTATVGSANLAPNGSARVRIYNGGAVETQVVRVQKLEDGSGLIEARFGRVFKRGVWTARVSYLGNKNFQQASADRTFVLKPRR